VVFSIYTYLVHILFMHISLFKNLKEYLVDIPYIEYYIAYFQALN
jgi:hypothetical protein